MLASLHQVSHQSSLVYIVVVVAPNFFFSSDLVKFFIMVHQVTNVSSFIECLELFLNFGHIFVGPSDVIPLAISDIHS